MEKPFASKIDGWLLWIILAAMAIAVGACIPLLLTGDPRQWLIVAFLLLVAVGLPGWVFLATNYTIDNGQLLIRSGPFRWRVPIRDITAITPTRSPLSSPALSLDRLEIKYGARGAIMVSPKDKDAFIGALKAAGAKV